MKSIVSIRIRDWKSHLLFYGCWSLYASWVKPYSSSSLSVWNTLGAFIDFNLGWISWCYKLYVVLLVGSLVPRYDYTHIRWHAASYPCCFSVDRRLLTVHPVSYIWWLHLQPRGGPSGVCVVVGSQQVTYWMKHQSFCSILNRSHIAEVLLETHQQRP